MAENNSLPEIDRLIIKYFKQGIKGRPLSELITRLTGKAINKNALCGRVHRLKEKGYLSSCTDVHLNYTHRKARIVNGQLRPVKPTSSTVESLTTESGTIIDPPLSKELSILELTKTTCRFPSDIAPFTFCGHCIAKGSYCIEHAKLCYDGKPKRRSKRNNQSRIRTIG